jgi:hypothetical protein
MERWKVLDGPGRRPAEARQLPPCEPDLRQPREDADELRCAHAQYRAGVRLSNRLLLPNTVEGAGLVASDRRVRGRGWA